MEKTFTIEQIKEQFAFDFNNEAKRSIADTLRDNFTEADAADMVIAIGKATEEHAKKYPEEAEAMKEWNTMDRIFWHVKEAYVVGVLDGLDKAAAANRMGIEELERGSMTEREQLIEIVKTYPDIAAALLERARELKAAHDTETPT